MPAQKQAKITAYMRPTARASKSKAGYAKRASRRRAGKKNLRRFVKKVLQSEQDTRALYSTWTMTPKMISASSGTTLAVNQNYKILTPSNPTNVDYGVGNINDGEEDNQRDGDRILTKSAILDYIIYPNDYDATLNPTVVPVDVRIFFFRRKTSPRTELAMSDVKGTSGNFLQQSSINYHGFVGTFNDYLSKMQTDNYTYLTHLDFKVGNSFPSLGTINNAAGNPNTSNNDYKLNYWGSLNLTKHFPKHVKWGDEPASALTGDIVTTPYVHMFIQVLSATPSFHVLGVDQLPVTCQFQLRYEYTDA